MGTTTSPEAFQERRRRLAGALGDRNVRFATFASGWARPRNFAHNVYPFRAESHFLYLTGLQLEGAVLGFADEEFVLYVTEQEPDLAIWEGRTASIQELEQALQLTVRPIDALPLRPDCALLPPQDDETATWLSDLLDRPVEAQSGPQLQGADALLADAMIDLRLVHDAAARAQLELAAERTAGAHRRVMRKGPRAATEAVVRGAFLSELAGAELGLAYEPIVTKAGEVLHARGGKERLAAPDLMLCDVGGETAEGWASDVTRTWPVSGRFSRAQRTLYELVLSVQKATLDRVRPGKEYAELHDEAQRHMAEGLLTLGLLRGSLEEVLERHAQAVFFPHGIGHLLGLDVHDMEDLGDRAGYAQARERQSDPSRLALRLDRPLQPDMAVTIEPGFYQIPELLNRAHGDPSLARLIDFGELHHYRDVRGIRIEDDVLVTETGSVVLSRDAPKEVEELEDLLSE